MMETCRDCPNWAQWKVMRPIFGPDPKDSSKQILVRLELVALVCGQHQKALAADPPEPNLRFNFVGAVPCR